MMQRTDGRGFQLDEPPAGDARSEFVHARGDRIPRYTEVAAAVKADGGRGADDQVLPAAQFGSERDAIDHIVDGEARLLGVLYHHHGDLRRDSDGGGAAGGRLWKRRRRADPAPVAVNRQPPLVPPDLFEIAVCARGVSPLQIVVQSRLLLLEPLLVDSLRELVPESERPRARVGRSESDSSKFAADTNSKMNVRLRIVGLFSALSARRRQVVLRDDNRERLACVCRRRLELEKRPAGVIRLEFIHTGRECVPLLSQFAATVINNRRPGAHGQPLVLATLGLIRDTIDDVVDRGSRLTGVLDHDGELRRRLSRVWSREEFPAAVAGTVVWDLRDNSQSPDTADG